MTEALYRIDGAQAFPSPDTAGPWYPGAQHGGAPAALLLWAMDRTPAAAPMRLTRFTMDLFRPAPVAPLEVRTEVVREGRNVQSLAARLVHEGKEVARATALKVRDAAIDVPQAALMRGRDWPRPDDCEAFKWFKRAPFGAVTDIRIARASEEERDGRAAWFRLLRPFFADEETTPRMRAAMSADYMNGLSNVLDFNAWTFINGDLSVHFAREPEGEWILVDAQTWVGTEGRGVAFAALYDLSGPFGRATQSLVIAPR